MSRSLSLLGGGGAAAEIPDGKLSLDNPLHFTQISGASLRSLISQHEIALAQMCGFWQMSLASQIASDLGGKPCLDRLPESSSPSLSGYYFRNSLIRRPPRFALCSATRTLHPSEIANNRENATDVFLNRISDGVWRLPRVGIPRVQPTAFAARDEYIDYRRRSADEYERRERFMRGLGAATGRIVTGGYCIVCARTRKFKTDAVARGLDHSVVPNWREGLICRGCSLNSRMRASIHLLQWALVPKQA